MTYLMVLVVRSDDPAVLVQLAEVAHRDVADARLAARLLHEDDRATIVTAPHILFRETHPAVISVGRSIPTPTGQTTDDSGSVVTFTRVAHDQIRIEASVDDGTGIVEGFLAIDDREPTFDDAGQIMFVGDDLLERSFVVARDAGPVAQILDADTLLIASAALTVDGEPTSGSDALPAGAETSRGRRQLLDELLLDRP